MWNFIKKVITRFFVVIGFLTVLNIALLVWLISSIDFMGAKKEVQEKTLLTISTGAISGDVFPETNYMMLSSFLSKQISLIDTLTAVRKAAEDPKILGIFIDQSELNLSYAQVEELRNELILFKNTGKKVWVWSDSYGEYSSGTKSYYLASAADKIFLQPSGFVTFNGISSTSPFLKNLLEKIKVEPIGAARKEYKTYWNMYSEEKFTEAHREATESLLNSIFSKVAAEVSESRKIPIDKVYEIADRVTMTSPEAVKYQFVDAVRYKDEVVEEMKNQTGFENKMSLLAYKNIDRDILDIKPVSGPKIAVIEIPGSIHRGVSDMSPSGKPESSGSATVVSLLKKAWKDENVKGIILRVNSPGGSVIASETIWNQVETMKKINAKPIIVSMGSVAASGGYYVSMNADRIFADHNTITGSIGVVIGKFYTKDLFESLGITFDSVTIGKNNGFLSALEKFTPEQEEYLSRNLDETYNTFVQRAADGRKMNVMDLEKFAHGRVWSGGLAHSNGLVDEIGGFMAAYSYMKEKIGVPDCQFVKYPDTNGLLSLFQDEEEEENQSDSVLGTINRFAATLFKAATLVNREIRMQSEEVMQSREESVLE
ncbi:signal peptide peptidase SppA [bacterium]|nr:signal peptide peptidase SppA [bacterium]MBQ4438327.1 signal peptide peptidase SppA [bacterium]